MRVSVTDLDAYRYYRENEDMTVSDYVARLERRTPQHPRAALGERFHTALEVLARDGNWPDHFFDLSRVDVALARPDLAEFGVRREYFLHGNSVTLSGRIDAMVGRTLVDYKTTRRIDLESYADAMQWRCYLALVPEAEWFQYEVFSLTDIIDERCFVADHKRLRLHRYAGLEDDVRSALADYYAALLDLERYGYIRLGKSGVVKGGARWE